MSSEQTPDEHSDVSLPVGWTGRDGAYGLGPNAPVPPWGYQQHSYPPPGQAYGYGSYGPPPWACYGYLPTPPPPANRHTGWKIVAAVAVVAAACAGGFGLGVWRAPNRTSAAASAPSSGRRGLGGGSSNPFGNQQQPTFGNGDGTVRRGGTASSVQSQGIVDVDTQLGYAGEEGAGTGMVMSSNGYILTNNHVVNGATSIDATVVATGQTYTATVVGTDPTKDVAVIKLTNASGLTTARFGTSIGVGAKVTGVGNAGGIGGTPSAAKGTVTALDQKLTASDNGANPEKLSGMIETDADIIPGDSGGPLYNSSQRIVGMDTAASSGGAQHHGFAIPIATARSIAARIESGATTSGIHQGYPGFLGVLVGTRQVKAGVPIASVVQGGPAQGAGLVAGDDITAFNGTAVRSATALHDLVENYHPGQRVTVTYLTGNGRSHTATITLATGPAD